MDTALRQLQNIGVHSIKNRNAILLEIIDTELQHAKEIDRLIFSLLGNVKERSQKTVILQCPRQLLDKMEMVKNMMVVEGERVLYTRSLIEQIEFPPASFDLWPINEDRSISFLSEVKGTSYQNAKAFLQGMKEELPAQAENMFTVYQVDGHPAGLVLPHIEPDTDREGRIFWIGMHPDFLGKGLGQTLHQIGLFRLQKEWKAKTYAGSTEINNGPMRKIMVSNGCAEKHTVLSLKYVSKERR